MFSTANLPASMQARPGDPHVCGHPDCAASAGAQGADKPDETGVPSLL